MATGATSQENGGGYPLVIFGNVTADEKFLCKFCDLVLRDPVQSFCGHRFCKSCVEAQISAGTHLRCKRCEQEGVEDDYSLVPPDQIFPDNAVKRQMSKLHVYCVNSGCDWNGIFKQYEEHCSTCPYQTIQCIDCNELITMGMMEEHKKQQCPQRVIICKHCKDSIRARENEEHLKVCPKQQIKCEACKKKLLREQIQNHMENECQSTQCPAGCGLILKSKYLDHLNSNIPLHMNWTIQNMGSMQNQVGQIQANTSTSVNELGASIQGNKQEIENRIAAIERQLVDKINLGQNIDLPIPQAMELHQMTEHLKVCPKQQINCEACKKKLLREQMQHHMENECQSIQCPAGCGLILKSKYLDHLNSYIPLHMNWVVQNMGSMQNQFSQIQVNINDFAARIEGQMQETDNRIAAIEQQLVDVINHGLPLGQNIDLKIRQAVELHQTTVSDRCQALEMKTGTFEGIASALHRELDKTIGGMEKFEQLRRQTKETVEQNTQKLKTLERTLALKDIAVAVLELRVQSLESASYDGTFVWKVTEFSKKQQDAINGRSISIYSPFFYTSRRGFKMCARLYPNGDGMGKCSHLSLFFVVMQGQYDALQNWPFKQRVSFCLFNQNGGEHVLDSFRPDPTSSSFRRPTSDMNIASGCPLFIRLESLTNPSNGFMKDDTIFIKVTVDTNELHEPLSGTDEQLDRYRLVHS